MTSINCIFLSILHRMFAFVCVFIFICLIMEETNVSNQIICENPLRLWGQPSLTIQWIQAVTSAKVRRPGQKLDCVWNVMAHAQKPDFVFRQNGRVHLNRRGRRFSRLLAAEVCASVVVMLVTPMSRGSVKSTVYPLHSPVSPSIPHPCVTVCHHISTGLYHSHLVPNSKNEWNCIFTLQ